jgi:hypothetical protein
VYNDSCLDHNMPATASQAHFNLFIYLPFQLLVFVSN